MSKRIRFSKSEMAGFATLLIIIGGWALAYHFLSYPPSQPAKTEPPVHDDLEFKFFAESISKDSIRHRLKTAKEPPKSSNIHLFNFDPNTADSISLSQLGLLDWQIKNIMKYRQKGGKWKSADDFSKLYGLSKEHFERLKPYICIKKDTTEIRKEKEKARRDSIYRTFPKKYPKGTQIELNTADTTALKGIPGIGSYYASKICRYRERLGGFISLEQLKEIDGLPSDITSWFKISPNDDVQKLHINQIDFKTMIRHPYMNYEQVKFICNYIQKYGKIKNWAELSNSSLFQKKDIERLSPYVSFE